MESNFALQITIFLIAGLASVCLAGLFEEELSEIISDFFALLLRPLQLIIESLQSFWRGVRDFYRVQFSVNGQLDLQSVFFQFIGAALYSFFFLAFNYAEFHLLALSLAAAGIDVGHLKPPIGAGSLTALAIIASFLFWGTIILDLSEMTNIAPWREALNEKWLKALLYITIFCLALLLLVTSSMGLFRGKIIADDSLTPLDYTQTTLASGGLSDLNTDSVTNNSSSLPQSSSETTRGIYYWTPIIANFCIPILVGIGGIFASWGIVTLIKFIMLLLGFLIISPLGLFLLLTNLLMNIIYRIYEFFDAIFQLFSAMGKRFMRLFGWKPESAQAETQSDTPDNSGDNSSYSKDSCSNEQETHDSTTDETITNPTNEGWKPFGK